MERGYTERKIVENCISLIVNNDYNSRANSLKELWEIEDSGYTIGNTLLFEYILEGRDAKYIEKLYRSFPFEIESLEEWERVYNKDKYNVPHYEDVIVVFNKYWDMIINVMNNRESSIYNNFYEYQIRHLLPKAIKGYEEQFVLVGYIPFNHSRIAVDGVGLPELMIPSTLRKKSIRLSGFVSYYPCDKVEPMAYTTEFSLCEGIRFPTKERAIIDYIRLDEDCYCPDYFADSLSRYLIDKVADDESLDELREVARYFGVSWDKVREYIRDYWGYNFDGDNTGWEEVAAR